MPFGNGFNRHGQWRGSFCVQAGIIEEMLEDTFESMDDQEEMEEAAEMEIDKILFEITAGMIWVFLFLPSFYGCTSHIHRIN